MPIPSDYIELPTTGFDTRRVETLWSFVATSPGEHLVLPDGRMDLIVRCRVTPSGAITAMQPAIIGPSQKSSRVRVATGDHFVGLRYRAGWGGVSLGVDPTQLRDSGIYGLSALDILAHSATPLKDARTPRLLQAALIEVARQRAAHVNARLAPLIVRAIDLVHLTGGRLSIGDAARSTGVPERTLRRHIRTSTGLSYKSLAAVIRFQRTIRLLGPPGGRGLTLAQAAFGGGYSDQAHMTREFRKYGGFTPGDRPAVALGSLPIGQVAEIFKSDVSDPE